MGIEKKNLIRIVGAREHNLKNVDVSIPKDALTVITGPSGSGKSSLALDILYTEGKRRYMESLSSYARQFLGVVKKPDVDRIDGLCPAIAIEQKTVHPNPRSTVGTITEIYDYMRVLWARVGDVHCPDCFAPIKSESPEKITQLLLDTFEHSLITVAAPIVKEKKGEFVSELSDLFNKGYYRFRIDGDQYRFKSLEEIKQLKLQKTHKHSIDLMIDALDVLSEHRSRLQEAIEVAFKLSDGVVKIIVGHEEHLYSSNRMCINCATSIPEVEPRIFSFNSPIGACPTCHGLGIVHEWPWQSGDPDAWKAKYPDFFGKYAHQTTCSSCYGKRLNPQALAVTIGGKDIYEAGSGSIEQTLEFFKSLSLDATRQEIAAGLLDEIISRLTFLYEVGLTYLSLNRGSSTLSGGEGQRIRLATQIGSALTGVLYVLDEPSIGLHQRDNDRLIGTLKKLRDQGNTVVVVEHDMDTIAAADYVVDMGPAAGVLGGRVTAAGSPQELAKNPLSLTGSFLSGKRSIAMPKHERSIKGYLTLSHLTKNNLKDITVKIPLGVLCGISGVSGSGKSTLVMQELVPVLERELTKKGRFSREERDTEGVHMLEHMVVIDQSPIGRTPRSNPATYLGVFDQIRKLFASLPESQARGYGVGRFSFNVADGRCYECSGDGVITVTMHFLPEVTMVCKVCHGTRYNRETLQVTYKEKNIAQILSMTAYEALTFFSAHPTIAKRLQLMCDVGLDYITLGQASTTLSGGEAQRIKLVDELAKRGNNTIYILDEPTTGLHSADIDKLLTVLNTLVNKGNSMIVIEHNLDVLKTVDYIIDMGPEGGSGGGTVVAHGTPREVARNEKSYTGYYLKSLLSASTKKK